VMAKSSRIIRTPQSRHPGSAWSEPGSGEGCSAGAVLTALRYICVASNELHKEYSYGRSHYFALQARASSAVESVVRVAVASADRMSSDFDCGSSGEHAHAHG
jgi:hypothetical protein